MSVIEGRGGLRERTGLCWDGGLGMQGMVKG